MKRIEMVMDNPALALFKQSAVELGISEFAVSEVRRSVANQAQCQRFYRGQAYLVEGPARTKVEFTVNHSEVERIVRTLASRVHLDRIAILTVDEIVLTGFKDGIAESDLSADFAADLDGRAASLT